MFELYKCFLVYCCNKAFMQHIWSNLSLSQMSRRHTFQLSSCFVIWHRQRQYHIPAMCKISIQREIREYTVISGMASQITSTKIVYSTVYSGAETMKAPRHWPLWREFTGYRWIPRTKGQQLGKCFYLMTSSWWMKFQCNLCGLLR